MFLNIFFASKIYSSIDAFSNVTLIIFNHQMVVVNGVEKATRNTG